MSTSTPAGRSPPLLNPGERPAAGEAAAGSRVLRSPRADRTEIYLSVWPGLPGSLREQSLAVERELERALRQAGAAPADLVWERCFLAERPPAGAGEVEAGRRARWMVLEPPCHPGRLCELQACAVVARRPGAGRPGREVHLAGIAGDAAGGFFEEALGMFEAGEARLRSHGMAFRDVVRTWIHLADMGRDYSGLNRARREFFRRRGIAPPPASTAIGGAPVEEGASGRPPRVAMALHAVAGPRAARVEPMRTPTLNEAPDYGSDFSRGMRIPEDGGALLHVSGTAAVDEEGRSVAAGDFEAQADRSLLNIEGLLRGQGAGFGNVLAAITYLKDRRLLARYLERAGRLGLLEVPHAIVEAEICRPELLCEVEVVAFR